MVRSNLNGKSRKAMPAVEAASPLIEADKKTTANLPWLPKRERTRRQIVASAMEVLGKRGIAPASVQEIAAHAGVTAGTFYNHFTDKADVIGAVAVWIIDTLEQRAGEGRQSLHLGAERMADGCHRYLAIARNDPAWAMLILDLATSSPDLLKAIGAVVLADVRLGVRQKDFNIFSEAAAVDLVHGCIMLAMRFIALRRMPASYERSIVATVLQGLGLSAKRARELALQHAVAKG
jgi:AcrR family transcriptional regulator